MLEKVILFLNVLFVGPLMISLAASNLKGVNAKFCKMMRSLPVTLLAITTGLAIVVYNIMKLVDNKTGFMIGPNRLTREQYDKEKLITTQGALYNSTELLAMEGHPFQGTEEHKKEMFIAQNLPLWTDK